MNRVARELLPWCLSRLQSRRPWVLGIQGPQGCGKSTAAAALVEAVAAAGPRAATVSIDDFYLTYDEQRALAARHPGNPYLLYRGYPGTHDVGMGARIIEKLAALPEGDEVLVPTYDKSARSGRGDRAAMSAWRPVRGAVDLVIVEGWMLGFSPVDDASIDEPLRAPNGYLARYSDWTQKLDAFVQLDVESLETIVRWRVDSERARRERGDSALSDADARDYIERFLPAYRIYLPQLRAHPPSGDVRVFRLGEDREPLGV
jgi:D-glycerate 3-kinase